MKHVAVNFAAYGGTVQAVRDISFSIEEGQTVALVGESGCGKSTLVNLVMHFNEPASGDIYLDGTNLRNISHAALRKNVTLVPQSTYIFSGTVEDLSLIHI